MNRRLLGAHPVAHSRAYGVAWLLGLASSAWSVFMGLWILWHGLDLFDNSQVWVSMLELIQWHWSGIGWTILLGGCLGFLGLATRARWVSLLSCLVGIAWCGWILAFLWYANFTGLVNIGSGFAILAGLVFVARFWLLLGAPGPDEPRSDGW